MLDQEIEELIHRCIDKCLKMPGCYYRLSFNDPEDKDGFNGIWNNKCWSAQQDIDPLTCVLLIENPERNVAYDDNESVSTVVKLLAKSAGWVRSFQHGYYGKANQFTSITGYLLGRKLRLKYLDEKAL
jgi:hypothetical protein